MPPAVPSAPSPLAARQPRLLSVDALRGLTMGLMIFVNDLERAGKVVPDWLVHYSDRHAGNGLTFVDLVFPAFLFIMGMSIPLGIGASLTRNNPPGKIFLQLASRTLALLFLGVLMVNEAPDSAGLGWPGSRWQVLMFGCAILAFSEIAPRETTETGLRRWRLASAALRIGGFGGLLYLAFTFVGADGHRIITLSPFSLHHEWWGILGLIGWAYLAGSVVFLVFRSHRPALVGCVLVLLGLFSAEQAGAFDGFWLAKHVGIGGALGTDAAIAVAGILLTTLFHPHAPEQRRKNRWWTVLFIVGAAAGAWWLNGIYGLNKNNATPAWGLLACATTATLWLVLQVRAESNAADWIIRSMALAGQNVLLAYLISEMLPALLATLHWQDAYLQLAAPALWQALLRSTACAIFVLGASVLLNRAGLRLKL